MNRISILMIIMVVIMSCSDKNDGLLSPDKNNGTESKLVQGMVKLPENSSLSLDKLHVMSIMDYGEIDPSGDFKVEIPDESSFQTIYFLSPETYEPILLGLYNPINDEVKASSVSTVLSMVLHNPMLANTSLSQKAEYLNTVKEGGSFGDLVGYIDKQLISGVSLMYSSNQSLYQSLADVIKEAMEELSTINKFRNHESPEIEIEEDNKLVIRNFGQVSYLCSVKLDNESIDEFPIEPGYNNLSFLWGFPPKIEVIEPEERRIVLDSGNYHITMTKGFDFDKISYDDNTRLATNLNIAGGLLYLTQIVSGEIINNKAAQLYSQIGHSQDWLNDISGIMNESDTHGLIMSFCDLLTEKSDKVSKIIFNTEEPPATSVSFLETASEIMKSVQKGFRNMGFREAVSPFFDGLIMASRDINVSVDVENDVTDIGIYTYSPTAKFTYSPTTGVVNQKILFDATSSHSGVENQDDLYYRWDWYGDGVWDVQWNKNGGKILKKFDSPGTYRVTLQVRNNDILTGSVTRIVNIDAGAVNVQRVKIIQDSLPWNSSSLIAILEYLGFTEGAGNGNYEIVGSDRLLNTDLDPETDLVIVSNDQSQYFYDEFAENQIRFYDFVHEGGVLFWAACDQGSARGFMEDAGIVLPDRVGYHQSIDALNYITDSNLKLIDGLPEVLEHQYASHVGFYDLPENSTIYTENSRGEATLLEFNLGKGWVMISGQPLEHQHQHAQTEINELLPRILSHLTGVNLVQPVSEYKFSTCSAEFSTSLME